MAEVRSEQGLGNVIFGDWIFELACLCVWVRSGQGLGKV